MTWWHSPWGGRRFPHMSICIGDWGNCSRGSHTMHTVTHIMRVGISTKRVREMFILSRGSDTSVAGFPKIDQRGGAALVCVKSPADFTRILFSAYASGETKWFKDLPSFHHNTLPCSPHCTDRTKPLMKKRERVSPKHLRTMWRQADEQEGAFPLTPGKLFSPSHWITGSGSSTPKITSARFYVAQRKQDKDIPFPFIRGVQVHECLN